MADVKSPTFIWKPLHPLSLLLWPLSQVFRVLAALRRFGYRSGILRTRRFDVPVLVVGNITVGGAGKTPLVIWAASHLRQLGYRPGVVLRGYGGKASHWPQQVRADSDAEAVGDEAVLIARRTGCPVIVGPDRAEAVGELLKYHDCDLVISDDGLQHYALGRDMEIAVLDGLRRLGNGFLLPAGPLREGRWRLRRVDMIVVNGQGGTGEYSLRASADRVLNLTGGEARPLKSFAGTEVHAVAGVGHPERFFTLLERAGVTVIRHPFADHHGFSREDLDFGDERPVLMTEKDAVKCERFARPDWWCVALDALPETAFIHDFTGRVEELVRGQKAARHPGLSDLQG